MRRTLGLLIVATLACCMATVVPAADKEEAKKADGKNHKVKMLDNKFEPANITVEVGDTITWTNAGSDTHTATSAKGTDKANAFDTKDVDAKKSSKPVTVKKAGKINYICSYHDDMKGTITVKAKK